MVKNKGGNKTKKISRKQLQNETRRRTINELMKEEGQEYAIVRKINGGGRFNLICADKTERIGIARATLKRNKKFIELGRLILVSLRDFEEKFCDVIDTYDGAEVELLVKEKLLDADFVKQYMSQKDGVDGMNDTEFGGFSIKYGDDSEDEEDDEKTSDSKKPSIEDLWDDI